MRLFIGIKLSEVIKKHLLIQQKQLVEKGAKGTLMRYENLHLTLEFIGEVSEETVNRIKDSIHKTVSDRSTFILALDYLSAFYKRDKAHTIWAGVKGNLLELNTLQSTLHTNLKQVGLLLQERPYRPHITLISRVKRAPEIFPDIEKSTFSVDAISLFQSTHKDDLLCYPIIYERKLL